MKKHKIVWALIAIVAVSAVVTACGSSPRNVPDEMPVTVIDVYCADINGTSLRDSQAGTMTMPDGAEAFFFENGKNETSGTTCWYLPAFTIQPGNFRGFTRFSFDVAADDEDVLADIYDYALRVIAVTGDFYDFARPGDWGNYKRSAMSDPTVFRTVVIDISPGTQTGWGGDGNPLGRANALWMCLVASDEPVPGKIYFRNLKFLK